MFLILLFDFLRYLHYYASTQTFVFEKLNLIFYLNGEQFFKRTHVLYLDSEPSVQTK
jgi:hypothetical protein